MQSPAVQPVPQCCWLQIYALRVSPVSSLNIRLLLAWKNMHAPVFYNVGRLTRHLRLQPQILTSVSYPAYVVLHADDSTNTLDKACRLPDLIGIASIAVLFR